MTISKELLNFIVCPVCKESLFLKDDKLVCSICHRIYPIVDDIPMLLLDLAEIEESNSIVNESEKAESISSTGVEEIDDTNYVRVQSEREIKVRQAASRLRELCDSNCQETELHEFLKHHFFLFHNSLEMNRPQGVYSKVSLGPTYETDFVAYFDKTPGRYWVLIEIEPPSMPLFNKNGDPSRYLIHAIRQVTDWQAWISDNQAYARTFLTDIFDPIGVVVIGRRASLSRENKRQLRQILRNNRQLEVMTYDRLIDNSFISADMNQWYGLTVHDAKYLMQNPPPHGEDFLHLPEEVDHSVQGLTRFGFTVKKEGKSYLVNPNEEFLDPEDDLSPFRKLSNPDE